MKKKIGKRVLTLKYEKVIKGIFIERPNRFVAEIFVDGKPTYAHVKNTGRCKELLISGAEVFLEDYIDKMKERKYRYSLVGVMKNGNMINMDSQIPNKVIEEALKSKKLILSNMENLEIIQREKTFLNSRFDFYLKDSNGKEGYLEVKGVTLEKNGIAMFPDAPTERGVKHINELIVAKEKGYEAYVVFLIQMEKIKKLTPNKETHLAFHEKLLEAKQRGVEIVVVNSKLSIDEIEVSEKGNIEFI